MKKILIIDDDLAFRETITDIIVTLKFHFFEAKNGLEGLEKVKANNPDLIIYDIEMPILNGYDFILALKKSNFPKTPVLFLSGAFDFKEKGMLIGAKACLSKPFTIQELKETINFCMNSEINS